MPQITVTPSQTQFSANPDETILDAAIRQGYNLPNGCQSGVCGTCAAQLVSGEVRAGEYDEAALSAADAQAGKVLLCCCRALGDVVLDIPAYGGGRTLAARTLPARIESVELRGSVAVVRVALPKLPPFVFYAGQYMEVLLNKDSRRSYSIASSPRQSGVLVFHVRLREGGLFSPQLFDGSLKAGSVIRLRGPLGACTLNEHSTKPLVFLATGTGLAPVKSMLLHLRDTGSLRAVHVYYGVRTQAGLYDDAEMRELAAALPDAHYTPVLSRADANWQGARGHVAEQVLRDHPDLLGFEVYACGLPEMVRESKKLLSEQAHLPEAAFFSDAFTAGSD